MKFPTRNLVAVVAAGGLLAAPAAFAADNASAGGPMEGQGRAVVTVLQGDRIPEQALQIKINGKESNVTGWTPLRGSQSNLEFVVLIDDGARSSLGSQLNDVAKFIDDLPPNAKVAVAYMMNGQATFNGPLTTDHAAVERKLHLPLSGMLGVNASPYFCLSDLAKHWPSRDPDARREVVMITDGIDNYEPRYDPNDPYVLAAIQDAVRAHLIVYSIYWRNSGRFDRTMYAADTGQNLLSEVTAATGGNAYWEGYGNPVSLQPFFADIHHRLSNQYELDFLAPLGSKPQIEDLKLKLNQSAKVEAPQQVYVQVARQ